MRGFMFRNRWLALLFVGMVLAGITRIVGTEEGGGVVEVARDQILSQHGQAANRQPDDVAIRETETSRDVVLEFAPDEELIDPATGYDPTPVDEFGAGHEESEELVGEPQGAIFPQDGR